MSRNTSVADLRMIGLHPALDFANTVNSRRDRYGPDFLGTHADLVAWGLRAGLLDDAEAQAQRAAAQAAPDAAEQALARAKALREAIYRLFSQVAAGEAPAEADLAALGDAARQALGRRALAAPAPGRFAWTWGDGGDLDAVAGRAAVAAADLLVSPEGARLDRVKECFGPNCGWLFLDTSRNGHRRWCSEDDCGVQTRVRRHRARQKTPAEGDRPPGT
jgi:predicted RNA-binding Zn ribbon-like protein